MMGKVAMSRMLDEPSTSRNTLSIVLVFYNVIPQFLSSLGSLKEFFAPDSDMTSFCVVFAT